MNSERWVLSRWSSLSDTARLPRELERQTITFGDDTVVLAPESGPGSSEAEGLRPLAGELSLPTLHLVAQVGNRFEAEHPELIGGAGVYIACCGHGPFIHIDTRGYRARWTGSSGG